MGAQKTLRVLCAREFQNSIADSVHKLLSDQIEALGLSAFYEIQGQKIVGRNGTEFRFFGIRRNFAEIKSYEGIDICWVEEAVAVSKVSWDALIPTIRKDDSEIWVSFNPEFESDDTYQRFVLKPPSNGISVKMTWRDNPWFSATMRQEMETLKERDYDSYLTVWEGNCRNTMDGAVYAAELRTASAQQRITNLPYERGRPVHTFWDLGRADSTSIWFAQMLEGRFHIIDFYEAWGHDISHYLHVLQAKEYVYGTHFLPHDAKSNWLGSTRTIEEQVRGPNRSVRVIPRTRVADGINAARSIFPQCWFDEAKCSDGLQHLRRYCYDVDPHSGLRSREPRHDEHSHAADAFRYLALGLRERPNRDPFETEHSAVPLALTDMRAHGHRWMA